MQKKFIIIFPVLLLIFVIISLTLYNQKTSGYNVVFISVDTLRPDHLGCYGYARNTSPTIDEIASKGSLFTNVIAQRGQTWPSLTSIMTSLYPVSHGVRENGMMLAEGKISLAEILRDNGYSCASFLANSYYAKWRGFEHQEHGRDNEITTMAIKWLKNNSKKKIFLWIHYIAPHDPYDPPEPYKTLFDPDYKGNINGSREQLYKITLNKIGLRKNDLNHIISLYDGEIASIDNEIKKLINVLRQLKLEDKTLIVFTADHGEDLYQHNFYFQHGASIHDSTLKIPLLFKMPGIISSGKKIDKTVESIDIAPTILNLLEISPQSNFEGTSLYPLIEGKDIKLNDAYSEWQNKIVSVRTDNFKYIYNPTGYHPKPLKELEYFYEKEELYNIKEDPNESLNIAKVNPEVSNNLREKILNWEKNYSWNKDMEKDYSKEVPKSLQKLRDNIAKKLEQRLKTLGYIN